MLDVHKLRMLLLLQWTAYNDRNGTYVPSIGEVYHTIMKRGYEINPGDLPS